MPKREFDVTARMSADELLADCYTDDLVNELSARLRSGEGSGSALGACAPEILRALIEGGMPRDLADQVTAWIDEPVVTEAHLSRWEQWAKAS